MPIITADKVVNQNLFAKGNVNAYSGDFKTVKKTFINGAFIGNVYSWVQDANGNLYWLIYLDNNDYNNFIPTYIKHDPANLDLPALPGILQQIQDEQDAKAKADKGVIPFYVEKYAPWIVGGVVVAVAWPAISRSFNNKNVSGMTLDNKRVIGLIATAALLWYVTKKKTPTGSVIVNPLDSGSFGTPADNANNPIQTVPTPINANPGNNPTNPLPVNQPTSQDMQQPIVVNQPTLTNPGSVNYIQQPTSNGYGANDPAQWIQALPQIDSVGVFPVIYKNPGTTVNGAKKLRWG